MSRTYYFSSSLVLIFSTDDFVWLFDDFNDFMSLYPLDKLYGYEWSLSLRFIEGQVNSFNSVKPGFKVLMNQWGIVSRILSVVLDCLFCQCYSRNRSNLQHLHNRHCGDSRSLQLHNQHWINMTGYVPCPSNSVPHMFLIRHKKLLTNWKGWRQMKNWRMLKWRRNSLNYFSESYVLMN